MLGTIAYDYNGLLNGRARDVGGAVDEVVGVELAGAGYAKERRGRAIKSRFTAECKVGEVFGCPVRGAKHQHM